MGQFRKYLNKISDNYFVDLNESPVAVIGDWDGFKDNKSIHISKKGFDKGLYEIVGETKYKDRKTYIYVTRNEFQICTFLACLVKKKKKKFLLHLLN